MAATYRLVKDQLSFFKTNGYLIVPNLLDTGLCDRARDLLWQSLPGGADIKRDDPKSHVGPFSERDTNDDPLNSRLGFRWQVRQHSTDADLIHLLYSDAVLAIAEQLFGAELALPVIGGSVMGSQGSAWPNGPIDPAQASQGVRGIYATLPYPENDTEPHPDSAAHTDGHPFMLSLVGLIDDCPLGGGAFTVWPGSHRRLYDKHAMQYDQARVPYYDHLPSFKGIVHSPEYRSELRRILKEVQPVDCWGEKGDVVFWHHRMVHCASENHSQVIRQAVLGDISRADLDSLRLNPPQRNMWQDWSNELAEASGEYSEAFARTQKIS
jgi:hypothetical protein